MASKTPFAVASPETSLAVEPAVISVQDVVHKYGDRAALNGVSFDVRPAELFGLLGPNGSGKTTLFCILSTLMVPVGGHATIMGFDVAREPNDLRRQIGVVFQAQSIDVKLTAAENLWHQGHLYGLRGTRLGLWQLLLTFLGFDPNIAKPWSSQQVMQGITSFLVKNLSG